MARPEVTGRRGGDTPTLALTIREFCDSHNISHAFFYLLQQRGEGPRVMKVGSRRLISVEEAAAWRAARTESHESAA
jgi:predicted DNA-binding transcriptional regulator AlpA